MVQHAVDYEEVRKVVHRWASRFSDVTCIWEKPDKPRPKLPYIALHVLTPKIKSGQDDVIQKTNDTYTVSGQRSMVVSVTSHYADQEDEEAINVISNLEASLENPIALEVLRAGGLAYWSNTQVQDISTALETGFENRITFDVTFGLVSSIDEDVGRIESTQVDGQIKDAEDNTVVEPSITIP